MGSRGFHHVSWGSWDRQRGSRWLGVGCRRHSCAGGKGNDPGKMLLLLLSCRSLSGCREQPGLQPKPMGALSPPAACSPACRLRGDEGKSSQKPAGGVGSAARRGVEKSAATWRLTGKHWGATGCVSLGRGGVSMAVLCLLLLGRCRGCSEHGRMQMGRLCQRASAQPVDCVPGVCGASTWSRPLSSLGTQNLTTDDLKGLRLSGCSSESSVVSPPRSLAPSCVRGTGCRAPPAFCPSPSRGGLVHRTARGAQRGELLRSLWGNGEQCLC